MKNCWRARKRTLAVDAERIARPVKKIRDVVSGDRPDLGDAGVGQRGDELVGRSSCV
jgi:hypothetical protein